MSDISRKGILNNSRKQSDFISRLGSSDGDEHVKRFIASCNAEMLVPFITITRKHNREVEYEIILPGSEGEATRLREALKYVHGELIGGNILAINSLTTCISKIEKALSSHREDAETVEQPEVCWNCHNEEKTVTAEGMCYDCRLAWRS